MAYVCGFNRKENLLVLIHPMDCIPVNYLVALMDFVPQSQGECLNRRLILPEMRSGACLGLPIDRLLFPCAESHTSSHMGGKKKKKKTFPREQEGEEGRCKSSTSSFQFQNQFEAIDIGSDIQLRSSDESSDGSSNERSQNRGCRELLDFGMIRVFILVRYLTVPPTPK